MIEDYQRPFLRHYGVSQMNKYEGAFKDKSALQIISAIHEANDVWALVREPNCTAFQRDAARRIHWLCEEMECRLGGHGGHQHATGPLLEEVCAPQLVEKERLQREIHRHIKEKAQLRTQLDMIKTIAMRG